MAKNAVTRPIIPLSYCPCVPVSVPHDPSTLNIALASTARGWHGGEEQALLLACGLRRRGNRCLILARRGETFARRMAENGFPVTEFSQRGWNMGSWLKIRRALLDIRADVLHYNDSHSITAAGVAAWGLSIPARLASRRVDFPVRSSKRYRHLCDRVLCVSRAVAGVCCDSGIPSDQLRVIHDGVDPGRVRSGDRARGRRSLALETDQPLLLTVAKLTDHKGHRFLLDAMPAIIQRDPRICLALAGDGELEVKLRQQARQLGIESHVRFLGFRQDIPDLIQAADIFVMPSHLEGLGSSLIDAMLAPKPIVTTTAGGIPDLTGSDESGQDPVAWTVAPGEPAALATAIIEALESPDLCAGRQRRARFRAEQLFTSETMVESTIAAYREVLERKS